MIKLRRFISVKLLSLALDIMSDQRTKKRLAKFLLTNIKGLE